jgi:hypothetical protein
MLWTLSSLSYLQPSIGLWLKSVHVFGFLLFSWIDGPSIFGASVLFGLRNYDRGAAWKCFYSAALALRWMTICF